MPSFVLLNQNTTSISVLEDTLAFLFNISFASDCKCSGQSSNPDKSIRSRIQDPSSSLEVFQYYLNLDSES